jgi:hypothetical protein
MDQKLTGSGYKRWEWPVRVTRKKPTRIEDRAVAAYIVLADDFVQRIWTADPHAASAAEVTASAGWDEQRMHLPILTFGVVATQIASIRVRLINVGIGRAGLPLQFDYDNTFTQQKYRIGPPGFEREFVLQNRCVSGRFLADFADLRYFGLEPRNRVVPGTNLRKR